MVDFQLPYLFLAALADALLSTYKLWEKVGVFFGEKDLVVEHFQN